MVNVTTWGSHVGVVGDSEDANLEKAPKTPRALKRSSTFHCYSLSVCIGDKIYKPCIAPRHPYLHLTSARKQAAKRAQTLNFWLTPPCLYLPSLSTLLLFTLPLYSTASLHIMPFNLRLKNYMVNAI